MTKIKELKAENKKLKAELDEYKRYEKIRTVISYSLCAIILIFFIVEAAVIGHEIYKQYNNPDYVTIINNTDKNFNQNYCQDFESICQYYTKNCQNQTLLLTNSIQSNHFVKN